MRRRDRQISRAIEVKQKYQDELLARPGVVGVGVGMRQREGRFLDEVVIVVTVTKKYNPAALNKDDLLPTELEGVPVDVQEGGRIAP